MEKSASLGERVASIETKVVSIREDVHEVKRDVKTLLLRDAARSGGDSRLRGLVPFVALGLSIASAVMAAKGGI